MSGLAENERNRLWSNFEKSGSVYDYLLYRSAVNGESAGGGLFDQNGAVRRGDDGFFGGFGDTNNRTHH